MNAVNLNLILSAKISKKIPIADKFRRIYKILKPKILAN